MPSAADLSTVEPFALLVTDDAVIADRLAGLAVAAGAVLHRAHGGPSGRPDGAAPGAAAGADSTGDGRTRRADGRADGMADGRPATRDWTAPALVLVGVDAVARVSSWACPPRGNVVLVAAGDPGPDLWRHAVAVGASHVAVLPDAEPWLLDRLLDVVAPPPTATVVGVIGGRGGAGASTLAASLAVVAARDGHRTTLVDVDGLGGGLDLVLGAEADDGLRWADLHALRGRMQPGQLSGSLPCIEGVRLLSWGRQGDLAQASDAAIRAVLDAAARESDLVVLDLPRRLGDPERSAVRCCSTVLLVVPAEVRATAAAGRVMATVLPLTADLRLIVRGPAPTGLPAESIADSLELPLAGELRPEPGLAVALDRGIAPPLRPRGPLATLCRRLAGELTAA